MQQDMFPFRFHGVDKNSHVSHACCVTIQILSSLKSLFTSQSAKRAFSNHFRKSNHIDRIEKSSKKFHLITQSIQINPKTRINLLKEFINRY